MKFLRGLMMGSTYLIIKAGPASQLFKGRDFSGVNLDYIIIEQHDLTKVRGLGKFTLKNPTSIGRAKLFILVHYKKELFTFMR